GAEVSGRFVEVTPIGPIRSISFSSEEFMRYSMLLFLAVIGIACAGGNRAGSITVAAAADDQQAQSPATTIQSFTAVDGADLMARLEAAQARARGQQGPYWSAYTFDVRPGVAIDPNIR